jgi:hypothetical protein
MTTAYDDSTNQPAIDLPSRADIVAQAHADAVSGVAPATASVLLQVDAAAQHLLGEITHDRDIELGELVPQIDDLLCAVPRPDDLTALEATVGVQFRQGHTALCDPLEAAVEVQLRADQDVVSFKRDRGIERQPMHEAGLGHALLVVLAAFLDWFVNCGMLTTELGLFVAGVLALAMLLLNMGLALVAAANYRMRNDRMRNDRTPGAKASLRRARARRNVVLAAVAIVILNFGFALFRMQLHATQIGDLASTNVFVSCILFLIGIAGAAAAAVLAYKAQDPVPGYTALHRAECSAQRKAGRERGQLQALRKGMSDTFRSESGALRSSGREKLRQVAPLVQAFRDTCARASRKVDQVERLVGECTDTYRREYLATPQYVGAPRPSFPAPRPLALPVPPYSLEDLLERTATALDGLDAIEASAAQRLDAFDTLMSKEIEAATPRVQRRPGPPTPPAPPPPPAPMPLTNGDEPSVLEPSTTPRWR